MPVPTKPRKSGGVIADADAERLGLPHATDCYCTTCLHLQPGPRPTGGPRLALVVYAVPEGASPADLRLCPHGHLFTESNVYRNPAGDLTCRACRRRVNRVGKAKQEHKQQVRHPLTSVYTNMKTRCYNERQPSYPNYGGRGIRVCDRWLNSFATFVEDVGPRPSRKHTLDRIDNDGNYEPGNCRWATRSQQNRNRRDNQLDDIGAQVMRTLHAGGHSYGAIAELFRANHRLVGAVCRNEIWKSEALGQQGTGK